MFALKSWQLKVEKEIRYRPIIFGYVSKICLNRGVVHRQTLDVVKITWFAIVYVMQLEVNDEQEGNNTPPVPHQVQVMHLSSEKTASSI